MKEKQEENKKLEKKKKKKEKEKEKKRNVTYVESIFTDATEHVKGTSGTLRRFQRQWMCRQDELIVQRLAFDRSQSGLPNVQEQ